jgi:hypothetical protein
LRGPVRRTTEPCVNCLITPAWTRVRGDTLTFHAHKLPLNALFFSLRICVVGMYANFRFEKLRRRPVQRYFLTRHVTRRRLPNS